MASYCYYNDKFAAVFGSNVMSTIYVAEDLRPSDDEVDSFYRSIFVGAVYDSVSVIDREREKFNRNKYFTIEIEGKTYHPIVNCRHDSFSNTAVKTVLVLLNFVNDFWEEGRYYKFSHSVTFKPSSDCIGLIEETDFTDLLIDGFSLGVAYITDRNLRYFSTGGFPDPAYSFLKGNHKVTANANKPELYRTFFEASYCLPDEDDDEWDYCKKRHENFNSGVTEIDYTRLNFQGLRSFYLYRKYGFYFKDHLDSTNPSDDEHVVRDCGLDNFWIPIGENEYLIRQHFTGFNELEVFAREVNYMLNFKGESLDHLRREFYSTLYGNHFLVFFKESNKLNSAFNDLAERAGYKDEYFSHYVKVLAMEMVEQGKENTAQEFIDTCAKAGRYRISKMIKSAFTALESEADLPFRVALSLEDVEISGL